MNERKKGVRVGHVTSIYLHDRLVPAIMRHHEKTGESFSDLVNRLLSDYLAREEAEEKKEGGSAQ